MRSILILVIWSVCSASAWNHVYRPSWIFRSGGNDGAFSIPDTSDLLTRGKLKMCKGNDRGTIHDTDDAVAVALWFLHTKLEDLQAISQANRTITDGYYRVDEEGVVSVGTTGKDYKFTKLALRDEISSTLGVVLLESGLNYTKLDLYVAFSNSMKYIRPVYVTRSLTCGHEDVYFYFIVMIFIIISIIFISTLLFSFTKSKSSNASHCHDNQQSSR